jgi:hypothetical protein
MYYTSWYVLHKLVCTTQVGMYYRSWYVLHKLVCTTQVGTYHTSWYVPRKLVCTTQVGMYYTSWYVLHKLVCTTQVAQQTKKNDTIYYRLIRNAKFVDKETVTKYIYLLIFEYFRTFKHFLPVLQINLRIVCGAIFVCQLFWCF